MDPSVESGKGADGEELGPPSNKCTKARQAFRRMQIIIKKDQKHLLHNITIVPPLKKIIYIIIKNTSMRRGRHKSLVSASPPPAKGKVRFIGQTEAACRLFL